MIDYNVAEYVGWFFMAYKMMKKWQIYLSFRCIHQRDIHIDGHTQIHTHGQADNGYRLECNVLHFA